MSRSGREGPVKVVIINTEYVETDALSFKSVVQRLTGKGSPIPTTSPNDKSSYDGGRGGSDHRNSVNPHVLNKGMSFKDLDKLLLDLPSMDDIYQFYAD